MAKLFFIHASLKATEGIRRVYESAGDKVHARLEDDGRCTIAIIKKDAPQRPSRSCHNQSFLIITS